MGTIYYNHRDYILGENKLTPDNIEGYIRQIADNEGMENTFDDEVSDENIQKWIEKHLIIKSVFLTVMIRLPCVLIIIYFLN